MLYKKYKPFNSEEGIAFIARWCGTCAKDAVFNKTKSSDDCPDDERCEIVSLTMTFSTDDPEYPLEWIENGSGPCCTAHSLLNQ